MKHTTTTPDEDEPTSAPGRRPVYAFDSLPEFAQRLPAGARIGLALVTESGPARPRAGTRPPAVLAYFETPQRVFVCAVATGIDAPQWSGASGLGAGAAMALLSDWFQSIGWRNFRFADAPPPDVDAAALPLDQSFLRERASAGRGLCRQR